MTLATPAQAADNLGWTGCTQRTVLGQRNLVLSLTSTYPLPPDRTVDGVNNSWFGRIAGAAATWDDALHNSAGKRYGIYYPGTKVNNADIAINYRGLSAGNLGYTEFATKTDCRLANEIHTSKHQLNKPVSVYITNADDAGDPRYDWFTQDLSRRSYWEACKSRGYTPEYTCSKTYDAGGVITHELGHTMALAHPQDVDDAFGTNATSVAKCGVFGQQATMCGRSYDPYRANFRTLESWDLDSLKVEEN